MDHPKRKHHFRNTCILFFLLIIAVPIPLRLGYPGVAQFVFLSAMVVFSFLFIASLGSCLSCGDFFAARTTCDSCRKFYQEKTDGQN